jgi:Beta/Gamma crystallin
MRPTAMVAGIVAALAAATAAVAVLPAGASPAAKAAPAAAPTKVTLTWIDASTGRVVRTWTGPPAKARAARGRVAPPAGPPAGPAAGPPAGGPGLAVAAAAIHRVSCRDPNSYWDVRNYPPLVCFANAGDVNVAIYSVYEIDSGNNSGRFTWCYRGRCHSQALGRWTSAFFSPRVFVSHIHIN